MFWTLVPLFGRSLRHLSPISPGSLYNKDSPAGHTGRSGPAPADKRASHPEAQLPETGRRNAPADLAGFTHDVVGRPRGTRTQSPRRWRRNRRGYEPVSCSCVSGPIHTRAGEQSDVQTDRARLPPKQVCPRATASEPISMDARRGLHGSADRGGDSRDGQRNARPEKQVPSTTIEGTTSP
jgi:hypothetical protein